MSLKKTIYDFLCYLANPQPESVGKARLNGTAVTLLFLCVFLFTVLTFGTILSLLGIDDLDHEVKDLFSDENAVLVILGMLILVPVFEELVFRYHLKYPLPNLMFITLSLSMLAYIISGLDLSRGYLVISLIVMVVLLTFLAYRVFRHFWHQLFKKHYNLIFYYTAVVFAYLHIYNFNPDEITWFLGPLLVLPQFILGLLLGYVRIRNNMWYSVYLHSINNLIPLIAFLSIPA